MLFRSIRQLKKCVTKDTELLDVGTGSGIMIYSIFMHFGFNIVYVFLDADIGFFIILTLLYLLITPIAIHIRNKTVERL